MCSLRERASLALAHRLRLALAAQRYAKEQRFGDWLQNLCKHRTVPREVPVDVDRGRQPESDHAGLKHTALYEAIPLRPQ